MLRNDRSNTTLKTKYTAIANKCKIAIFNFDLEKENKILKANNLGAFYKFANKRLSSPSGIAPLVNSDGKVFTSEADKAKLLSEYFSSVYTTDNGILPHFPKRIPPGSPVINDITITPTLIYKLLSKLKSNSAAGPDKIPPIFYRKSASSICFPLSILLRSFVDLHEIPDEWRVSIVIPKFKKGSPSTVSNYRPISLTCTACKILESLIASDLLNYLHLHNLISKDQHGFLKKHSTTTNLLSSLNDWTLSLQNHYSVTVAYIDFHRAFDSISHPKLLHKLIMYGVEGNLLFWIKSFLRNRSQYVRIGSSISFSTPVTSGVPQGSCLGPLLFNIFINDITDLFGDTVHSKLFADDIKIYTKLKISNYNKFQDHLNSISSWALTWQIGISHSKCNILQLGSKILNQNLSLSNQNLPIPESVNDLGVLVDKDLKFKEHIHGLVGRARQRSALIFRCFLSRNILNYSRAFKTYVRPILEYASPAWSPSLIHLIDDVEDVQRTFTKRLPGFMNLTYPQRLTKLKLQSLEHRRLIADLTICFNIVHGFTSLNFNDFFKFSNYSGTRGHMLRLEIPFAKLNIRKNFFACRVVKPWNALPAATVNSATSKIFKNNLYKIDLSLYLKFPCVL